MLGPPAESAAINDIQAHEANDGAMGRSVRCVAAALSENRS